MPPPYHHIACCTKLCVLKPDSKTGCENFWVTKSIAVSPKTPCESSKRNLQVKSSKSRQLPSKKLMFRAAHFLFGLWGVVVLGLHMHASRQPIFPQCLMQVRPWFVARTSCYLVGLDCYTLGINGKKDEMMEKWSKFDSSTVVQMILMTESYYLGNPIKEIPPEVFEVQGMLFLSISNMNINELPRNVTNLSAELSWIFIGDTNISFFWAWTDELVERMKGKANPWLAGPSPYCDDLARIENDTATAFSVPLDPEYSQTLMDPSNANRDVILKAVPSIEGLFYPLELEDSISAISPPLLK
ncbi:hypothetical protein PHMEG_0004478 [Phytophthora megakarya]|uniref:Uncharacterized protein n=1 Tax=Phytophthora megakarya TaxID=4795 RepID=A0A225WTT9_9STRA|nr:hypothetical protein PHMEG_0004478 [Phytophthora megakarya]